MDTNKVKRDFVYASKAQTEILLEQPCDKNPYISKKAYLHGYDLAELIERKSFVETLLLLFTGELPKQQHVKLLERLMIALINLGPRHPAVKASMVAGGSKSNTEHLLPIGLSVLGGETNGANEVAQAVTYLQNNINNKPVDVVDTLMVKLALNSTSGECHPCPGFGEQYGAIDILAADYTDKVLLPFVHSSNTSTEFIDWVLEFNQLLNCHNLGILTTGLAATVFCQLRIPARESIGLFQLLCAPGIFAHGVEQTHKPITSMPMLPDENYIYQPIKNNGNT